MRRATFALGLEPGVGYDCFVGFTFFASGAPTNYVVSSRTPPFNIATIFMISPSLGSDSSLVLKSPTIVQPRVKYSARFTLLIRQGCCTGGDR
jgi:hypothetical protein